MAIKKKTASAQATEVDVARILNKIQALKADRANWERNWQDIGDYILQRKNEVITKRAPGEQKHSLVFDNTAIVANELLAGSLHGMLTSPNAPWFDFTTGIADIDRQDDVRVYLQECARRIHSILNSSNFQTEIHEYYLDLGGFNTACLLVEEIPEDTLVRFAAQFIAHYYIDEDHLGKVNQVYKEWKWDTEKLVSAFGVDALPEKVRESYAQGKTCAHTLVHAVYPEKLIPGYTATAKPWCSHYILVDQKSTLKVERFFENPYIVSRWAKASGEKYGRGPGMAALPEVKSLNKMAEVVLKGAQKVVDPPLQLPDDGFIMPIRTKPGSLNYYRAGTNDVIRPVFNDTRIDFGFQAMQEKRLRVREAFYIDQLTSPQGGPARTATEVMQRAEEQMRLMGPTLGRQQEELAGPLIDRVFGIANRRGKLPPPPDILKGMNVKVRYTSLIARTQRASEASAILRTVQTIAPFVQADPTVLDNIDGNVALKVIAEVYGFPQEIMRTQLEVDRIRKGRAQQQAQMQAQMQAQVQHEQTVEAVKATGALNE